MKKITAILLIVIILTGLFVFIRKEDPAMPRGQNYSNRSLSVLPSELLRDTSVEVLDLSNNNLKGALPAEIRLLKKLRILDVSNNQMTGIPAEIGQLEMLEELDYSNNQLTGLPLELGNLKRIKKINFSGNKELSQFDLSKIRAALPKDVVIITD